jgi:formyltetrahydrofolate-dependent phosphoribosylglycinamide formyltransferase
VTEIRKRAAVLISGRGSNMAALIDAAAGSGFPAEIALVLSDRPDAAGLELAARRKLSTRVVAAGEFPNREAHEAALDRALREQRIELICLAGYMRRLSPEFVARWSGRMINIHPSLLPLFPGLDTHRRALEAGLRIHGATVHFVTDELDQGPIVAQAAVPVHASDTEPLLTARVLKAEHRLYPLALRLVAEGRARMENGRTVLSGLDQPMRQDETVLVSPLAVSNPVDLEQLARITP